jgi:hypothetical protein
MTEKEEKVSIWETIKDARDEFIDVVLSPREREKAFKGNVIVKD